MNKTEVKLKLSYVGKMLVIPYWSERCLLTSQDVAMLLTG